MNNKRIDNSFDIKFDIIIIGGGLAGLTLACGMLDKVPNAKIALIEKNKINIETNLKLKEKDREQYYMQQIYSFIS